MSYQRQWYAPQGWYEEMGQPPGLTPTNAEKAAVMTFQAAVGIKPDGVVGPATQAAIAKAGLTLADVYAGKTAPARTLSPGLKTTAKVIGLGLLALTVFGVVYVARKI